MHKLERAGIHRYSDNLELPFHKQPLRLAAATMTTGTITASASDADTQPDFEIVSE